MSDDSEPVPKLPRGRGMKFSGPEMFRIAITIALLVAVVVLTKPCSHAVSTFVMGFDGSAKPPVVNNGFGSAELIPLRGLNDQQIKSTVERAQLRGRRVGSGADLGSAGSAANVGSAGPAANVGSAAP